MNSPKLVEFMQAHVHQGLTFDDVSLVTKYADFLPSEASIATRVSRNIPLNMPFVSAAMDTVTESEMAIGMARLGGIGVIHKNLTPEAQASQVSRVKHYLNGLISKPVVFRDNMLVSEVLGEKERHHYTFSGFPILGDDARVVGILTARDMKFLTDYSMKVSEIMTHDPLVGGPETDLNQAFELMVSHKVGKLPIVDADRRLVGLYSFHDVKNLTEEREPAYSRDDRHRLRVAAAIGPGDQERVARLVAADVDMLVIDTAHGHSKGVIEMLKLVKREHPEVDVVAGNIGTGEAARDLMMAGADAVKVGIGPGSICTTRVVAGVGIPQISAIYAAAQAVQGEIPVIADGGIKYSGDVAKALAVGASVVMMGSALAGTEECPGERILHQGRRFVVYRGMGSLEAMKSGKGSRERYSQGDVDNDAKLVPQGIEGMVPYRGPVSEVLHQYAGGVHFSLGYCGSRTIPELQSKAELVRVSAAGRQEAHPHDVTVVRDAPNYRAT